MSIVPTAKKNARHTVRTLGSVIDDGGIRICPVLDTCELGSATIEQKMQAIEVENHFFALDLVTAVRTPKVILRVTYYIGAARTNISLIGQRLFALESGL
jgi:hypothetical protein